jgi:predicted Zn-dependent protease
MKYFLSLTVAGCLALALMNCSSEKDEAFKDNCGGKAPGGAVDIMGLSRDLDLGLSVVQQIESNPSEYPLLDSATNHVAYGHLYRIRNNILNSGKVYYKDDFPWRMRIIRNDNTLNAFCTPGGFIYVYTGLIKYLDNETQLAGVIGHEIAHADRRHSASQMLQQYGLQVLISIFTSGNTTQIATIAGQLIALKFSRSDETEADDYSVRYLYGTEYDPRGAKYFFEKIGGSGGVPEFLSTHPNPDNRVENIEETWKCLGSGGNTSITQEQISRYTQFKNSLP